jgi:hypothetical protein
MSFNALSQISVEIVQHPTGNPTQRMHVRCEPRLTFIRWLKAACIEAALNRAFIYKLSALCVALCVCVCVCVCARAPVFVCRNLLKNVFKSSHFRERPSFTFFMYIHGHISVVYIVCATTRPGYFLIRGIWYTPASQIHPCRYILHFCVPKHTRLNRTHDLTFRTYGPIAPFTRTFVFVRSTILLLGELIYRNMR